ncbi:acetoacetate decarboxylase family protein [Mesorhizobium sp. DCY119]|uniref:acetoacetate decarboxylase family protein n=1 Tax=Mesorhizobium sp. DCY119 TaxID=2108445 RepID=UPI000E6C474E|nr:acetoacetate decarboxylase family protein [Mesorhizobium sp. DCY119]RJG45527.1 acetoacetate decarboxylase [Mesorhizobium sp. DCY119]
MAEEFTEVEFADQKLLVPRGGYYDRFRSNPDLNEVVRDPTAGNIDWFRRIPKQKVESRVGSIWAPNFYYRASTIQLLMTAPLERLQAMLPMPLEPLRAWPGRGLVALTFFSYAVCDNDPYDEVSIAVVVRRPGAGGSSIADLLGQLKRRSFYAHVLALPVTTEIARVRGVFGYQLPKWLTGISVKIGADVRASIAATDGSPDLTLEAPLPKFTKVPSQSRMGRSTMVHQVDGRWHTTTVQSNTLSFAQKTLPREVTLTRHSGPMTDLLNGLGASRILQLDVVRDVQLVLNMPVPLNAPGFA